MKKLFPFIFIMILAAIATISLLPSTAPPEKYHTDKLIHFFGYFFVTIILASQITSRKNVIVTGIMLLTLSLGIEYAQNFVPGRNGTYGDALTNLAGIITGTIIILRIKKKAIQ